MTCSTATSKVAEPHLLRNRVPQNRGRSKRENMTEARTSTDALAAMPVAPSAPVDPVLNGDPNAPVEPPAPLDPVQNRALDEVRGWLARFITPMRETDLDLLTLWAAHTHLVTETYTTPRLVLDSPTHGSGKTTVLEHLQGTAPALVDI